MGIPQYVLMVRKKDMFSFFEENKIIDNKTSFLSSYSSSNNTYTFTNIAPLITYCIEERKKGITAAGGDPEKEEDGKKWDAKNTGLEQSCHHTCQSSIQFKQMK